MKIIYLSSIIVLGLVSCNQNNEKTDQENKNNKIDSVQEVVLDTLEIADSNVIKNEIPVKNMNFDEKIIAFSNSLNKDYNNIGESDKAEHLLDKSNAIKQSIILKKNSTISYGDVLGIYPQAHIFFYKFINENDCNEVFSAWLECFGGECDKLTEGQNMNAIKMPPMYVIKNQREIIVLKYMCEHEENNWNYFKDCLNYYFQTNNSKIIDIGCGGPLNWK